MEKKFKLFDEIYMIEWENIAKVVWCNRSRLWCTRNEKDDIDVVTKNFAIKKEQKWYRMDEKDMIFCSKDKLFTSKSEAEEAILLLKDQ